MTVASAVVGPGSGTSASTNINAVDKAARLKQFLNSADNTSYNFEIDNNTDANFADLVIQSDSGAVIYKQSKSNNFSCQAHSVYPCKLAIKWKKKPKGSWSFKFYGDDKTLTSAYVLASPTSGSTTITPQDIYLGHYAFSQIKNRYKTYKHLHEVGRKLEILTGSTLSGQNAHKAILEALAADMKNSKIANNSMAENKYFSKFEPKNTQDKTK
jgi:hypothetical protein